MVGGGASYKGSLYLEDGLPVDESGKNHLGERNCHPRFLGVWFFHLPSGRYILHFAEINGG